MNLLTSLPRSDGQHVKSYSSEGGYARLVTCSHREYRRSLFGVGQGELVNCCDTRVLLPTHPGASAQRGGRAAERGRFAVPRKIGALQSSNRSSGGRYVPVAMSVHMGPPCRSPVPSPVALTQS